ncbi:MAG: hypothetical protein R3B13_29540 [Polyangiaceae bacterium]
MADDVMRVSCTAVGRLPGGRSAKSHLTFGGDPRKKNELITRVLEIVARGVVTRLAELERVRRGDLEKSRVRAPNPPGRLTSGAHATTARRMTSGARTTALAPSALAVWRVCG